MTYQHLDHQGQTIALPVGKAVCVGRNYLAHIQEMGSRVTEQAVLFMKPSSALVPLTPDFAIPVEQGEVHHEVEIAVLIGEKLKNATVAQIQQGIWGYGLALDLTLRDIQRQLKADGQPWERAKAFDASCPLSGFVPTTAVADPQQLQFSCHVNGQLRQQGDARLMLRPIFDLIEEISQQFTLLPGDVVLSGTPAGVGPLSAGDQLALTLMDYFAISTQVRRD